MSGESERPSIGNAFDYLLTGKSYLKDLSGEECKLLHEVYAMAYFPNGEEGSGLDVLVPNVPQFSIVFKSLDNDEFIDVSLSEEQLGKGREKYVFTINDKKCPSSKVEDKLQLSIDVTKEFFSDFKPKARWALLKCILLDATPKQRIDILESNPPQTQKDMEIFKKLIGRFKLNQEADGDE